MTTLTATKENLCFMDTIDGFPQLGESELVLKHKIKKKLIKRKGYINKNGQDMPETRDWNWKQQQ